MGARVGYAGFILGPNGHRLWLKLEQRQLPQEGVAVCAACGSLVRGFPVEQPRACSQVEQGELRGRIAGSSRETGSAQVEPALAYDADSTLAL